MASLIPRPWLLSQEQQNPAVATGRRLRWGMVSTGSIVQKVSADLALLQDAELYAVSSRSQQSADTFASGHGFSLGYGDDGGIPGYRRMVEDPEVDVVYVGTPHAQHYEVARAALEAGKPVLVEKALTINAREAESLVSLAREKGLFLMEAMWSRFLPSMQRAFEIARSGELGTVQWISADLGFPAPANPDARIWARKDGGGALLDLSVYPLLWPLGILGFPDSVVARGTLTDQGVDAQNLLSLGYSGGAQAGLNSSLVAHGPGNVVVAGDQGVLQTFGSVNNPKELHIRTGWSDTRVESFETVGTGYSYELREVTRCIQQGLTESPTMPWSDSVDVMRLFDGVRAQLGVTYPNDEH
ncbi:MULTISPECIES: Gfo/Idh/MocA family oxidoreductase [Arthrobacter]|uniref:Gfo/Idh/MocA family oxidoreductase n=2 Tax=Arthrobacter TaxID=1663 RepID=A0ABU9KMS6_9MICC|nr:Gfo/Idh/MocA family oxidoreductase [Arthrobacter sp. YJM1]MDP5227476.1 Gfo/Idh/MocA family oxidoreductase [Arthrobacter sp. YJM1]